MQTFNTHISRIALFIIVSVCGFTSFAQKSYTYNSYGIYDPRICKYVVEVHGKLVIEKTMDNHFKINTFEEGDLIYDIAVKLKSYNELKQEYIYIGTINIQNIALCDCVIASPENLEVYLKNNGFDKRDWPFPSENNQRDFYLNIWIRNLIVKYQEDVFVKRNSNFKIVFMKNITVDKTPPMDYIIPN